MMLLRNLQSLGYGLLGLLAGVGACTGDIGNLPDEDVTYGETQGSTSGGATGLGALPPELGPQSCNGAADPGSVVLHRLNNVEYDNSIRDLIGDTSTPSLGFPKDNVALGFDNEAAVLSVSSLHVEKYSGAATALVDSLLSSNRRSRVLSCSQGASTDACVQPAIAAFAAKAWRRPLGADTQNRLMALYQAAIAKGGTPEQGLRTTLRAILVSPRFLFRTELDADPASTSSHPLDPFELASRLSYFLWSSTPDGALLDAAAKSELTTPAQVGAQVGRMLADPRAAALTQNFAGQWMGVRQAGQANPNAKFAAFTPNLRNDFLSEASTFFQSFLVENKPPAEMLTASYSYINDALAKYYGLPLPGSSTVVKRSLQGSPRAGLLTQGSWLLMTSTAARTSPVRRGKWVLGQLLCSEPPPPPPNVPALTESSVTPTTLREQMQQHRASASCAACHNLMDPIGLAFENFDAVGQYRATDTGNPIDTRGTLPDGTAFEGQGTLAASIAAGPEFDRCFSSKVFGYALGRQVAEYDNCTLDELTSKLQKPGAGLSDLINDIAQTSAFRLRHAKGGPL
jgi:Protein of unknown function (DUF1592)/Protein of unknown function (DUF1588)/Protein of unknown function (DUF1595)/Protein of unknown function (DUF1587)/Protein of unknown function (DUF1585)